MINIVMHIMSEESGVRNMGNWKDVREMLRSKMHAC
jgi:hypothetical protein